VATISAYSSQSIQRDLGVAPERISVLPMPCDDDLARRVIALRESTPLAEVAFYAGNFLPHKNLPRLIAAFRSTEFRRAGGRLVLVGGSPDEVRRLQATLRPSQRPDVDVRPACPQDDLDLLYATSRFLVLPSLEEGFGLPAWEALSCGLPVAVSSAGALPEVVGDSGEQFDPTSVTDMAQALDRCAVRARHLVPSARDAASLEFRRRAPALRDLGEAFLGLVAAALGTSQGTRAATAPSRPDGDPV
jgi:alpha-1,3-rhamnosyl/mannosyltransferase